MVNVYKEKDVLKWGSYRGIKLLDQIMMVLEMIVNEKVRSKVDIGDDV